MVLNVLNSMLKVIFAITISVISFIIVLFIGCVAVLEFATDQLKKLID